MEEAERKGVVLLENSEVYATLPAQDLERAKSFYADKLGMKPTDETPEEATYETAKGGFALFRSHGKASGDHTQLGFTVDDIEKAVDGLRERGVKFEEYDLPGLKTVDGIAEIYGEKGAWFFDSEGNLLSIGQRTT
jgi:catechol 2,3-dioxygenase-like lactoylglutathione lyase family enzyme